MRRARGELRCSHDPVPSVVSPEGEKKVKGIIHWVPSVTATQVPLWTFEPSSSIRTRARWRTGAAT